MWVPTTVARFRPSNPMAMPSPMLPVQRSTRTASGCAIVGPRGSTLRTQESFGKDLPGAGSKTR